MTTSGTRAMVPLFTYTTLSVDAREIRLLDIEPLHSCTPQESSKTKFSYLRSSLRHVSLIEEPRPVYETVSYCWGDPEPLEAIEIDECILRIPRNTLKVLLQLALSDRPRTLWIDAICIDQTNKEERSQQVTQMREIYSYGTTNLIYLGPDHPLTNRALENLSAIHQELTESLEEGQTLWDLVWPPKRSLYPLRTTIDVDALVSLYSCPWFTRVWVVQEAILATKNVVIRGSVLFELAAVLEVPMVFYARFYVFLPTPLWQTPGFNNAGLLWNVQRLYNDAGAGNGVVLYRALTVTGDLRCLDPRDKVFGVLGIARTYSSPRIIQAAVKLLEPDYSKSVADVYRDATRFCIVQSGVLHILSEVLPRNHHDRLRTERASWTLSLDPDPNHSSYPNPLLRISESTQIRHDLSEANHPDRCKDLKKLEVCGFVMESIAECTAFLEPSFTNSRIMTSALHHFLGSAFDVCQRFENSSDNLARALTANRDYRSVLWKEDQRFEVLASLRDKIHREVTERVATHQSVHNDDEPNTEVSQFGEVLESVCRYRRIFATASGALGIASAVTQPNDVVAFLLGAGNPCTLRSLSDGTYLFLGNCYLNTMSNNHDIEQYQSKNGSGVEWFSLV